MAVRATVRIRCRSLWLPKRGHTENEYEDAFALSEESTFPFRMAVADGATEAAFSRVWADRLVEEWTTGEVLTGEDFLTRLPGWQAAWKAELAHPLESLPWYAAAKAEQGAYATFLGVYVAEDHTWQAIAVGDCVLFHLRGAQRLTSWPLDMTGAFNHTPNLVPSRHDLPPEYVLNRAGTWKPGDTFLLATDALADWLLHADPGVAAEPNIQRFEQAVVEARESGTMRNDDVTAVWAELG